MYYVLRKQPSIDTSASQAAWEADFAKAIADYMREIILLARPTKGVYVSCDGAVCAAKRRQQRLRRFKGPWIAAAEAEVRRQAGEPAITRSGWDQNALTPGTAFMAELGRVLIAEGARIATREGIQVTVSTTSEHGEGEHKLLRAMRALSPAPKSCVIYGLDADLILLSMLLGADTGASVHLLREAQEFEGAASEGEWRCLSVGELVKVLLPSEPSVMVPRRINDFVAGMSLLGNDFLPRSLTKTVRDDGIPTLIRTLDQQVWRRGLSLVDPVSGAITRAGLLAIVEAWAATEDEDLVAAAKEAQRSATRPAGIGASPAETALREWSAQPARWAAVTRLLTATGDPVATRRAIYEHWTPGSAANYCAGVAWTWDYYSGRVVDQSWVFDEHLPPLWSDVAAWLSVTSGNATVGTTSGTTSPTISAPAIEYPTPLPDWLHLLAVLPMDSLRRLLPSEKQTLSLTHPWYWPTEWALFDVGRGQMWECEAMIPLIPERVLRTVCGPPSIEGSHKGNQTVSKKAPKK
jgi:5'-3' exonuclease